MKYAETINEVAKSEVKNRNMEKAKHIYKTIDDFLAKTEEERKNKNLEVQSHERLPKLR